MTSWVCSECGSADIFELGWIRTNRISWMLEYDVDVLEYHGGKLGRGKLYDIVLDASRQAKEEVGGYLQYTTQAVAGIVLENMHRELGKAVRRKNRDTIGIEVGEFTIANLRSLARNVKGKVYDANGKRVLKGKVA